MPAATTEAAFRALLRVFGLVKRAMEPHFARFGITGAQWGVLRALDRAGKEGLTHLRLTDLGNRLLVRPPSITGVVGRLEHLGLVARRASQTDLRAKHVNFTPAGRKLVGRVLEVHSARIRTVLGGLSLEEQGRLLRLLNQVAAHLEGLVELQDGPRPSEPVARRRRKQRNTP
jgi:DNA-binding MarR family transcriptional regulator